MLAAAVAVVASLAAVEATVALNPEGVCMRWDGRIALISGVFMVRSSPQ